MAGFTALAIFSVHILQSLRAQEESLAQVTQKNRDLEAGIQEREANLNAHESNEAQLRDALELAEIQKSMQEHASRRFQSLFDGLPVGAMTFDQEGTIFEWNTRMSELVNTPSHFAILHHLSQGIKCVDQPEIAAHIIESIFEKGEAVNQQLTIEVEGKDRVLSCKFFPLRNLNDEILGGIGCFLDVTEEIAAQRTIAEMADLQSAVLNAASHSIIWADQSCQVIGMNPAAEQLLGYKAADCIASKSLVDFHMPTELFLRQAEIEAKTGQEIDDPAVVLQQIAQQEAESSEWQYLLQDGSSVDVEMAITQLKNADGSVRGYLTVAKDITEEKAVAERLKMLSMVAQETANSVLILDASGHILFANPAFEKTTGYLLQDVIGHLPFSFRESKETSAESIAEVHEAIRRQQNLRTELLLAKPDRDDYWSRISLSPVKGESGFCTHIVVIEDDVTEQKIAQLRITESEGRFRDVVEAAGEYIWEVNADFRFTYVSSKISQVLGYSPEEVLGHSPLDFVEKTQVRPVQNMIAQSVLDGVPVTNLVLKSTGKGGQLVWQKMNAIPFFDAEGELRGFRGTGLDITEQKVAEDALAAANQRVKRILESINDSFYSLDKEGRFTYVNSSAAMNCERNPAELIGTYLWDLHTEEFWQPLRELFEQVGTSQLPESHEFYFPTTGSWLEFRVYPNQEGGVSVFYQDISERRMFQAQLEEQMAELNQAYVQLEIQQLQLEEANKKLLNLATTDGLTGLKNHKTFQEFLSEALNSAEKTGTQVGVVLMDVDKFKLFNDGFGHLAGDEVLKKVARCLETCVKEPHLVARYGGEEFVIVGVGLSLDELYELADECRAEIEDQEWKHRQVTASFGVSMLEPDIKTKAELIDRADQALYASKEAGRNRVTRWIDLAQAKAA